MQAKISHRMGEGAKVSGTMKVVEAKMRVKGLVPTVLNVCGVWATSYWCDRVKNDSQSQRDVEKQLQFVGKWLGHVERMEEKMLQGVYWCEAEGEKLEKAKIRMKGWRSGSTWSQRPKHLGEWKDCMGQSEFE